MEPLIERFENNIYIKSFKEVMISIGFPIALAGSLFYIAANPPRGTDFFIFKIWLSAASEINYQLMIPYYFTLGFISVIAAFAFSYKLSQKFKIEPLSSAIISALSYLALCFSGGASLSFTLNDMVRVTGPNGLFIAFLVSVVCINLLRFINNKRIYFNINSGITPELSEGLKFLLPLIAIVPIMWILGWVINIFLGEPLPSGISSQLQQLLSKSSNLLGEAASSVVSSVMYFLGMDGGTIKQSVNCVFINQGGYCLLLPIIVLYIFSYSKHMKHLGRCAIIPGLFNMPFAVIFSIPLLLNPIYLIPFILSPLINTVLNYLIIISGYLSVTVEATQTMPVLFSGYFATSGEIIGPAIQILNFVLSLFIYYPFFRYHETSLLALYGTRQERKMASKTFSKRVSVFLSRIPSKKKETF